MTSTTMELLWRVLLFRKDNDKKLSAVADALERFRVRGRPVDEIALRQAAEAYLKKAEA